MAKLFCDLFVAFIFHYQRVQNCAYACLLDIIECDDPVVLNALIDQVSNFTVQWVVLPCVCACWRRFAVQWGASSGLHLILFSCSSSCSSIIICPPPKNISLHSTCTVQCCPSFWVIVSTSQMRKLDSGNVSVQRGIENVILIAEAPEARNVMMNRPPRNCKEVCILWERGCVQVYLHISFVNFCQRFSTFAFTDDHCIQIHV